MLSLSFVSSPALLLRAPPPRMVATAPAPVCAHVTSHRSAAAHAALSACFRRRSPLPCLRISPRSRCVPQTTGKLDLVEPVFPEQCEYCGVTLSRYVLEMALAPPRPTSRLYSLLPAPSGFPRFCLDAPPPPPPGARQPRQAGPRRARLRHDLGRARVCSALACAAFLPPTVACRPLSASHRPFFSPACLSQLPLSTLTHRCLARPAAARPSPTWSAARPCLG